MTQNRDGTGGPPVVDSTDVVGRIYDQSTVARIYTSGVDSRRARFRDNPAVFDGRKCLEYDKVDDVYTPTVAWGSPGTAGAQTWAVEFQVTSGPAVNLISNLIGTSGGAPGTSIVCVTNSASYQTFTFIFTNTATAAGVGFGGTLGAGTTANRRRLIITYNGGTRTDPANYTAHMDGVAQTIVTSGNLGNSTVWGAMGGTTSVSSLLGGRIGRIAAFSRVLTAGEISSADGWLNG